MQLAPPAQHRLGGESLDTGRRSTETATGWRVSRVALAAAVLLLVGCGPSLQDRLDHAEDTASEALAAAEEAKGNAEAAERRADDAESRLDDLESRLDRLERRQAFGF
ncbi:MAG: alanine-zipper protein [Caulobacter sp.]